MLKTLKRPFADWWLIDLMVKHPELIRRPLLFNDQQLQVGFSEDDIRSFLPRQVRRKHLKALMSAEAD